MREQSTSMQKESSMIRATIKFAVTAGGKSVADDSLQNLS